MWFWMYINNDKQKSKCGKISLKDFQKVWHKKNSFWNENSSLFIFTVFIKLWVSYWNDILLSTWMPSNLKQLTTS